uniref:Uncharacterized protein n=1 Tax=Knipowitschia caucasica TaxID=637954 RepID=A0AAV2JG93_KNICA
MVPLPISLLPSGPGTSSVHGSSAHQSAPLRPLDQRCPWFLCPSVCSPPAPGPAVSMVPLPLSLLPSGPGTSGVHGSSAPQSAPLRPLDQRCPWFLCPSVCSPPAPGPAVSMVPLPLSLLPSGPGTSGGHGSSAPESAPLRPLDQRCPWFLCPSVCSPPAPGPAVSMVPLPISLLPLRPLDQRCPWFLCPSVCSPPAPGPAVSMV